MSKTKNCSSCNAEIKKSDKICPNCGAKNKKPFYKKWWIYVIVLIVAFLMFGKTVSEEEQTENNVNENSSSVVSSNNGDTLSSKAESTDENQTVQNQTDAQTQKNYEFYSADELVEDMDTNPMRAELKYTDKYVQLFGVISNFDSDGEYFSVTGDNNKSYSIHCSIDKNDTKTLDTLLSYNIGDGIVVYGKVTEVGEILGYTIKVDGISEYGVDFD